MRKEQRHVYRCGIALQVRFCWLKAGHIASLHAAVTLLANISAATA
jgi:hypothetical protein